MIMSWNYPWTDFLREIQRFNSGTDTAGIKRLKHYLNGNIKMWPVYHNTKGQRAICKVLSKTEEFTFCVQCGKRAYVTDNGALNGILQLESKSSSQKIQELLREYSKKYHINILYLESKHGYQVGVTMNDKQVPLTIAMARVMHMFLKLLSKFKLANRR